VEDVINCGLLNKSSIRLGMNSIMQKISVFSILATCLLVTACSGSLFQNTKREPQVVSSPDKVSLMLAEAADKASNALETLAAVEQEKSPAVAVQPIHNAPPELRRSVTLTWAGPAEQVARLLSDRASYTFLIIGNAPPVPLVVNVDVQNQPVIEVLRDLGLQLGGRADIKVDGARKVVELHYAPVTGLGG
jgi:defect-in-organelle-trafficking protein DotD